MNWQTLIAVAIVFSGLAFFCRRSLRAAQKSMKDRGPVYLPPGLDEVILYLDRWKSTRKISQTEYERLMSLCREEADSRGALPAVEKRPGQKTLWERLHHDG